MKQFVKLIGTLVLVLCVLLSCSNKIEYNQSKDMPARVTVSPDTAEVNLDSIPNAVSQFNDILEDSILLDSDNATFMVTEEGALLASYSGSMASVIVPGVWNGHTVVGVAPMAFDDHPELQSLQLPGSITFYEQGLLKSCSNLKVLCFEWNDSIDCLADLFSKNNTTYADNPYRVPDTLQYVKVSGNLPDMAFWYCSGLVAATIQSQSVGAYAFYKCSALKTIELKDTVTIGEYAFAYSAIERLSIPNSVTRLEKGLLMRCTQLKDLDVPMVGNQDHPFLGYLFGAEVAEWSKDYYPELLWRVTVQEGCNELSPWAFYKAPIRMIELPSTLKVIGIRSFSDCDYLRKVELPGEVITIDRDAFFSCDRLEKVVLSKALQNFGSQAFYNCYSLRELDCPIELTYIPDGCFYGCQSLLSLAISDNCEVGNDAFLGCPFSE